MSEKRDEIRRLAQLKGRYIRAKRTTKWSIDKHQRYELHLLAEKYPRIAKLPLSELDRIVKEVER